MNSAGSGDWSTGATWVGGVAPTAADAAVVLNTHTVTINDATCVCDSLTINSGGTVNVLNSVDTKLVVDKGIQARSTTGHLNIDMSAAPTKKCEIYINNDRGAASLTNTTINSEQNGGKITLKGAVKKTWTLVDGALVGSDDGTGALTCNVDEADGWQVADKLVFATTQAFNTTPKVDTVTIATITAVGGGAYSGTGAATITWTDGAGTGGRLKYSHADNCIVGNFTRNLVIGPATAGDKCMVFFYGPGANSSGTTIDDVEFRSFGGDNSTTYGQCVYFLFDIQGHLGVNRCAFWDFEYNAYIFTSVTGGGIPRTDNVYYSTKSTAGIIATAAGNEEIGTETDMVVFRAVKGIANAAPSVRFIRPKISGLTSIVNDPPGFENRSIGRSTIEGGGVWACKVVTGSTSNGGAELTFNEVWLGKGFSLEGGGGITYAGAGNDYIMLMGGAPGATFNSCPESLTGGSGRFTGTSSVKSTEVRFYNRDNDSLNQDIYRPEISTATPCFSREATVIKNANAALLIDTLGSSPLSQDFEILVKGGEAAIIHVWCKKDASYGSSTRPTAQLTGLGTTLPTVTCPDNTAWNLLDLSYDAVDAPSADGILTLTLTAQSATTTGKCYFSGIPIVPFVTRARHYAYVVAETTPTLTTDPAIDPGISQATAAAYTNITITWGATSSISTGADQTFKKLVHYTAAKMVDNVASALPITWAGAYNAPAIFAQGAINISGDTLNGSGSIDMGAHTLTSTLPWAYTYTGGTFSQAATVPSFAGGTLNIGAAGTFTYTQAASMTVSATPTSASNYVLSSGTFTGILNFQNTTAYNITVEIPAGVTANSTGSPGAGTVTFVSPQVYQSVVITGFTAGSRIYIYDTEGAGELLFNGTASAGETVISGSTCTWTDATAAAANRVIFLRVAYVNGATAKEFIEVANIGTCGTTDGTKTVSYIVAQTADAVYDANAVTMDGTIFAACGITFTDAATDLVNINIAADTVALKTIYAAFAWWIFTSPGIDDDVAYIRAIDPANYELTSMKFRNTSTDPLKITDGYFYDSTGSVENCVDVAGSSGNIYPMPAHVVPYQTTGTYAITGDIATVLAAIPSDTDNAAAVLAAAQASPIHSEVKKVATKTVSGAGIPPTFDSNGVMTDPGDPLVLS